jgi:pseudaminic acid cytidylyltransferase
LKNLAIIPARGGSKRIPRKNTKDFLGMPIISYAITVALNSGIFDEVMVSTEDQEIAEIAINLGAKVPFMRSMKNATDFSSTADVIDEVITEYEKQNISFDNICCIYPTAVLLRQETLKEALEKILAGDCDSVYPVQRFSYPIQRAVSLNENLVPSFIQTQYLNVRSQDLEACFHDSGQFYFLKKDAFLRHKSVLTPNTQCLIISELDAQDIDNQTDWKLAELKFRLRNS